MTTFEARVKTCPLLVLLALSATLIFGQAVTGTIYGVVTDASDASVLGAKVQIQNVDTGFSRTEQTDENGRYLSQNLPLGAYSVIVQMSGFKTEERRGITLTVASQVAVNVQLAVGNIQERVEVSTEAPAVETSNATVSQLTTGEQVRDLPLNGRSMDALAGLTPGLYVDRQTSANASVGFGGRMTINGGRMTQILYLLDGMVINDPSGGAPVSAARSILGVEGILEFRLLTHNFSAEYGRVSGAVFSMVTRSGTNQLHGSAYEFLRNDYFDARNFFNTGGLPPYRRNQFGGSVGGRIIKDRLFFFANYEAVRQSQGITINAPVPDAKARVGLLPCSDYPASTFTGPCNSATGLGQVTVKPEMVPFINLYPLPNGASLGAGTAEFRTVFNAKTNEDYGLGRLDYRISDKDNFYLRYVNNPANRQVPRPVPIWGQIDSSAPHFFVLSETHVFSSSSLNEFRASFNRVDQQANPAVFGDTSHTAGITYIPGQTLGQFTFAAGNQSAGQLAVLGPDQNRPQSFPQNVFQESDTFSTVRGAHSLKFGVDVTRVQLNLEQSKGNIRGSAQFGGLVDFLRGTPSQVSATLANPNNIFQRGFRRSIIGMFVQDDIRIRSNLTLNLGLREDIFTTPTEVNGLTGALINLTDPAFTRGKPFNSPWNTISPRMGVAWDPFKDGKTAVRGGFGLYYNPVDGRDYYNASLGGNLWVQTVRINNPPFPDPFKSSSGTIPLPAVSTLQYDLKNTYTYNYNVEVQRQLTTGLSLRAAYVGSVTNNLIRSNNVNTRTPAIVNGVFTYPSTGPLLNPNFSNISFLPTDGRSNYNALQSTLTQRFSEGLRFVASFTWAKAMSNTDQAVAQTSQRTASSTMNPTNLDTDYSLSAYHEPIRFNLNGTYLLPFGKLLNNGFAKKLLDGWALNGIYTYSQGLPINMLVGFNNSTNGDNQNPDRPNLNPGFSQNPINGVTAGCAGVPAGQKLHTPELWMDPCAFSLPASGTFGNLGRNTVMGPGTNQIDASLVKSTALTERLKLDFRFEVFNVLNHPQFAIPNLNLFTSARSRSGSGGVITGTLSDNRDMQFGLKLIF